jgi:hypothetical protein
MKTTTRERAIRTIVSSFLQSDLTAKELSEISDGFLYEPDFIQDIGNALYQLSDIFYNNRPFKKQSLNNKFEDEVIEKALETIKRKRLSKAAIVSKMKKINPDISTTIEPKIKKMTVKNLLSEFLSISGLSDFTQFVNTLDGQRTGTVDKYLEGILNRS